MQIRDDLEFSVPLYGGTSRGLQTLGDKEILELEDGTKIELLPYLLDTHCKRGISRNDPRIRRSNDNAIKAIAPAYADHYNNSGLDEHWSVEDAENMMHWHYGQSLGRFFFVKWARNMASGEEFPVGFITAYAKPYQSGKILWDCELFVVEEYRRYGIGRELIKALLLTAESSGIHLFEALTYKAENEHPYKMWEKYGASATDLIHISGEVEEMLEKINTPSTGMSFK